MPPPRIRVDRRSKVPAYLQIVEQVRAMAASGLLRPGDQLPTIRCMAGEAGINFNTVARAYRVLDEAGVISTERGRGTYAVARLPRRRARRARGLDLLVQETLAAAARIGYGPQEVQAALVRAAGRRVARPRRLTRRQ
jgi:GntR family transcriptional regulator